MKRQNIEAITKAVQCSDLLIGDIREAHTKACQDDPVLAIVLADLIADAVKLNQRLGELEGCLV